MDIARGALGLAVCIGLLILMSENRRQIPVRVVVVGVLLQVALALLLLRVPGTADVFGAIAWGFNRIVEKADAGMIFLFGEKLASPQGPAGFVFAIRVLSVVVFFSAFIAVLYYFGIMQRMIGGLAWLLQKSLNISAVEALVVSANVFVGQSEAPLCIRPYLPRLSRAQIATMMIGGFATMSGTVLGVYVAFLGGDSEASRVQFTWHLLTASLISAPAAFMAARILVPETGTPFASRQQLEFAYDRPTSVFAAISDGATLGMRLAASIAAMLIAYLSLLALVDWPVGAIAAALGLQSDLRLANIFGWILTPLAWCLGVQWEQAQTVGALMGKQVFVNEFVAYRDLGEIVHGKVPGVALDNKAIVIATYAFCGFSNFSSIAVQVGALSILVPAQREVVLSLALRGMLAGAIACWTTACVAGMVAV